MAKISKEQSQEKDNNAQPDNNKKLSQKEKDAVALSEITQAIAKLKDNENWLIHLHDKRTEQFINDNNRIWNIGSIFIPLSLVGLAGLDKVDKLTVWPLAIASILLIGFWQAFSDNHRAFQAYHEQIIRAIERQMGVQFRGVKFQSSWIAQKIRVVTLRWIMFFMVFALWVAAIIAVYHRSYVSPETPIKTDHGTLIINIMPKIIYTIKDSSLFKSDSL